MQFFDTVMLNIGLYMTNCCFNANNLTCLWDRETPTCFICIPFHLLTMIAFILNFFPQEQWEDGNTDFVCKKILEWTKDFLLRYKMVTLVCDLWQLTSKVHHVITQSHLLWTKSLSGMVLLPWKWIDVLALKCHHCPLWE